MEGVEVEVLPIIGSSKEIAPIENDENRDWGEELCSAILNRFQEAEKLNLAFIGSDKTAKEKLQAIISFKSAMTIPALKMAMGLKMDPQAVRGSNLVIELLDNLEASIYSLMKYEESESVDFNHPKVVRGMTILVEALAEVLKEVIKDNIVIQDIVEKMATRLVGFEDELNKRTKGLSNKFADSIPNPFSQIFLDKNRDPKTLLTRLREDLVRANNAGVLDTKSWIAEVDSKLSKLVDTERDESQEDIG